MPIHDAALSEDGSILAVAYSNVVTLWSPLDNMLQHTLPHPLQSSSRDGDDGDDGDDGNDGNDGENRDGDDDGGVRSVSFVGGSPLLVTTTDNDLYVWNLLTCDVLWELHGVQPLQVCCTSSTSSDWKESARIAVLTNHSSSKRVLLFNATKSTPIFSWSVPEDIAPMGIWFEAKSGHHRNAGTTTGGAASSACSLLLVSASVQLYQFHQNVSSSNGAGVDVSLLGADDSSSPLSNFQRMFGQRNAAQGSGNGGGLMLQEHLNNDHNMMLVDGPSHVVASISNLFDSFMKQSGGVDAVVAKSTAATTTMGVHKEATPNNAVADVANVAVVPSVPFFRPSVRVPAAQTSGVGFGAFDTASEEMLMEWFSKDGELLSSVAVPPTGSKSSTSKSKKRIASVSNASKKQSSRKSKRVKK